MEEEEDVSKTEKNYDLIRIIWKLISRFDVADVWFIVDFSIQILVLDASGSYGGGFRHGQNYRPANPEHCKELNKEIPINIDLGPYNDTSVPFHVQVVTAKYEVFLDMNEEIEVIFIIVLKNYVKY